MRVGILLAVTLSLSVPIITEAQSKKKEEVSAETKKQAKAHYEKSETHFRLAEYEQAVVELKEAYRLYPKSDFLYNLGLCYHNLKDYEQSTIYFENFLAKDPTSKRRPEAEQFIKDNQKLLAEAEEKKRKEEEARKEEERLRLLALQNNNNVTDPGPPKTPIYKKGWFWGSLGGASALGVTAAIVLPPILAIPKTDLGNKDILDQ